MVGYKPASAVFTEEVLFPHILFAVSGYVLAVAMGAIDFYLVYSTKYDKGVMATGTQGNTMRVCQ
jgi:hypothetical protein